MRAASLRLVPPKETRSSRPKRAYAHPTLGVGEEASAASLKTWSKSVAGWSETPELANTDARELCEGARRQFQATASEMPLRV